MSSVGAATNPLTLLEISDPSSATNTGFAYTNDISGRTELMYLDDTGAEIQLTSAGNINSAAIAGGADGTAFHDGGDSFGANATLGTGDNFALILETNNTDRGRLLNSGELILGTTALTGTYSEIVRLNKNQASGTNIVIDNTNASGAASFVAESDSGAVFVQAFGSTHGFPTDLARVWSTAGYTNGMIMGCQANGPLMLYTNNTERARFLGSGEFLVNTTTQINVLDKVSIDESVNNTTNIRLRNNSAGASASANMVLQNNNSETMAMGMRGSAHSTEPSRGVFATSGANGMHLQVNGSAPLMLRTNATERARILGTGEFLIGSTTLDSTEKLLVQSNQNAFTSEAIVNTTAGTTSRAGIFIKSDSGSMSMGHSSSTFTPAFGIQANEAWWRSSGEALHLISPGTEPIKFTNGSSESARFDSAGALGIGQTTVNSALDIDVDAGGTNKGFITIEELLSVPASAPANSAVIYAKDNGSGKTQFVVRFATGAEQVLATEP